MSFPYTEVQLRKKVANAAAFYWKTRRSQAVSQKKRGVTDAGTRGQVTGGRHLDGFARLIKEICIKAGFKKTEVFLYDKNIPTFKILYRAYIYLSLCADDYHNGLFV